MRSEKGSSFFDTFLSVVSFSLEASFLPVYSYMLGICDDCYRKIRDLQGWMDGVQAFAAMSPVSQGRLRSRAINVASILN